MRTKRELLHRIIHSTTREALRLAYEAPLNAEITPRQANFIQALTLSLAQAFDRYLSMEELQEILEGKLKPKGPKT